jgi:ferric-dicitrate binding protein FerR (iron transport regulator)
MKFDEAYILAYLRKEISEDEICEIETLMKSSSKFLRKVKQISFINSLSKNLKEQKKINTYKAWNKLLRKISRTRLIQRMWDISRTAAAVLLPLFLLYQYMLNPLLNNSPAEMITITSAPGIVSKTILPDGSEVWLNSQSVLSYPQSFSEKDRTVRLFGEAYFKVISDTKNRFNVVTPDNITVSAFGTEFNVNAYKDEKDYQITLVKGKVDVTYNESEKKENLPENHKAVFDPQKRELVILPADPYVETAWKTGKMIFHREKLENIAKKLSKKFGVEIKLKGDVLRDYEYTATFTNETIEEILYLLQKSAPLKYSVAGQKQLNNDEYSQRVVIIEEK